MKSKMATSRVKDRRQLRFETIDDCISDIDRIMAADAAAALRAMGNWTPGQVLSHVAAWIEYSYEGFPVKPLPRIFRPIFKLQLRRILKHGMPPGVTIPGVQGGTTGADDVPVSVAGPRLKRALERLATDEPEKFSSPAFGSLSIDQRRQLMLRHAELHMSFLRFD